VGTILIRIFSEIEIKVGIFDFLFGPPDPPIEDLVAKGDVGGLIRVLESWSSDYDKQMVAIKELGNIGDASAFEPLIQFIKKKKKLGHFCIHVFKAIRKIDRTRAVEFLTVMLKDKSEFVRKDAVGALGDSEDDRAVEPLLMALKYDKDLDVRSGAAYALSRMSNIAAKEALIDASKYKEWRVRKISVECMGWQTGFTTNIIYALKDEAKQVRVAAAKALGEVEDSSAEQYLREALNDDNDEDVRIAAAYALKRIGSKNT